MTKTVAVRKDRLKGIFDTDSLKGAAFKVTITPISEAGELPHLLAESRFFGL